MAHPAHPGTTGLCSIYNTINNYALVLLTLLPLISKHCRHSNAHKVQIFWEGHTKSPTLKFIYSEKDTIFFEISTVDLSYVGMVKSTVEISQNCVAFSECMNFETQCQLLRPWIWIWQIFLLWNGYICNAESIFLNSLRDI